MVSDCRSAGEFDSSCDNTAADLGLPRPKAQAPLLFRNFVIRFIRHLTAREEKAVKAAPAEYAVHVSSLEERVGRQETRQRSQC